MFASLAYVYGTGKEETQKKLSQERTKTTAALTYHKQRYKELVEQRTEGFSEEELIKEIERTNIKYPSIVLAQAKFESGNFKSNIFKFNRNLFGMRLPASRPTTATGERKGFAVYNDWRHSVYDYAIWQAQFVNNCETEAEYLERLTSYAGYKEYGKHLKELE